MSANSSTTTTRKRLTVNDLALIVANLGSQVESLVASQQAQHSTPTVVAEVTAPVVTEVPAQPTKAERKAAKAAKQTAPVVTLPTAQAAPVVQPAPAQVKTTPASVAGDQLMAFVESKQLAFAKGGRTHLDRPALEAIARVLKTGTSEIVTITREALNKRGITGLAIGLDGEGGVLTQYVFDPSKTRS